MTTQRVTGYHRLVQNQYTTAEVCCTTENQTNTESKKHHIPSGPKFGGTKKNFAVPPNSEIWGDGEKLTVSWN